MKTRMFFMLAALFALAFSCNYETGDGQNTIFSSVSGEGPVVKKKLDVKDFHSIHLSIAADIELSPGGAFLVEAEGQENIIGQLNTVVSNGTWKVTFDKSVRNYKGLKIRVTMPSLKDLKISGSGDITGTGLFESEEPMELSISGSGNIALSLDAPALSCTISGSGNMKLKGNAGDFEARISGSGDIEAGSLNTRQASLNTSGSGNIKAAVSEKLTARTSGSGDIQYIGKPQVDVRATGSGNVRAIN